MYLLQDNWTACKFFASQWLTAAELEEIYFLTNTSLRQKASGVVFDGPHLLGDYLKVIKVPSFITIHAGGC